MARLATSRFVADPVLLNEIKLVLDPQLIKSPERPSHEERSLDNQIPLELWSAAAVISDRDLRLKFLRAATAAMRRRGVEE